MIATLQLHPEAQRLRQDYAIEKVRSAVDTAAESKAISHRACRGR
jgi:hypothetical protein